MNEVNFTAITHASAILLHALGKQEKQCTFSLSPQRGIKNAVFIFHRKCKQLSAITSKRYEIGCQLLLITDKKFNSKGKAEYLYSALHGIQTTLKRSLRSFD